ncbi:MAG: RHS repeat-associated core domain-containing protein, partial [Actinobacteria bacterium]|nr:RHS repeat-associated core domain-containing protein [Actinomycetota bacterium]
MSITATTRAADGAVTGQRSVSLNGHGLVRLERTLVGVMDPGWPRDSYDIVHRWYDASGRPWKETRPHRSGEDAAWNEVVRDVLGRVIRTYSADGTITYAFHDEAVRPDRAPPLPGPTTRLVDAWGRERWMQYDALGQLRRIVLPDPERGGLVFAGNTQATFYDYKTDGQVRSINKPYAQSHQFFYDGLGRLTHQIFPERQATLTWSGEYRQPGSNWTDVFAYADSTRLAWHMDARGVKTVFHYGDDPLGRLQRVTYELTSIGNPSNPDPVSPPAPASEVGYEYVSTGDLTRLARVTTDQVIEEFDYDKRGRLAAKRLIMSDHPGSRFAVDYGYDTLDRLRSITYPAQYGTPNSPRKHVELEFDRAGLPHRMTVDSFEEATVFYAPGGLPTQVTVGGRAHVTEQNEFDPANGLLVSQRIENVWDQKLLSLKYDYRRPGTPAITGQLVRVTDHLDVRRSVSYLYDGLAQLWEARGGSADTPLWTQHYTYDRFGNRTNVVASGTAPDGSAVPFDGPLTLITYDFRTNRIDLPGYAYDETGNLTRARCADGTWRRYQYDFAGRLVTVRDDTGAPLETHTYGPGRQRLRSHEAQSGAETSYIWHGDRVIAEYDTSGPGPQWSRSLVYLGQRLLGTYTALEGPSGRKDVVRYHHPDRRGTRLITTPETGETVDLLTLPYGTLLQADSAPAGTPRLTSYDRSPLTGLDYAVNRYYDAQLGRFLQTDPIGLAAVELGQPETNNAFAYVSSDPINAVDPTGLSEGEFGGGGSFKQVWVDTHSYDKGPNPNESYETVSGYWESHWV